MPALMIAGPGELHDEELEVLGGQVIAHYGEVWTQIHRAALSDLGRLLGSSNLPYVIPGSGSTCLDAAMMNVFEPGEKVAIANTGFFGVRLMDIARANQLEVIEVPVEIGEPVDPTRLAEAAEGVDGIVTVHVDTSTGVRHPIAEIAAVAKQIGATYMVDGIASIGAELADVDAMGIDILVTASQKGLEAPPGLGVIALGDGGRQRIDSRTISPRSWYLDLKTWDRYREEWAEWHPHPVTMPTSIVLVMAASLRRILGKGLEAIIEERSKLARRCREGLAALGLSPVPAPGAEANLVVAAYADEPERILKQLLAEGIQISGGLAPLKDRSIRIGLMGRTATPQMVDRILEVIGQTVG